MNKLVAESFSAAWRPSTSKQPWEWAANNVKISNSERGTFFDPDQTPWWKAPMECAGDSSTRQVVVIAPTGSGKSTMAEALIPYIVAENPGSILYASQTDEDAKFWAETRLKPAMKSCKDLKDLWPEDRHKSRKLEIIFPHLAMILGGANLSNFQEKSVRWLYGDEVWNWKAGLVREFMARHHNRWNRKVYLVSQGGYVDGELDMEWQKSDMGVFSWRCECGEQQPFEFDGIKFEYVNNEKGEVDVEATAGTARICCRECDKEYADEVQTRRRLTSSNMDNGMMGYIPTNKVPHAHIRGFRIDSLAIWWIPWKDEVKEFIEATKQAKQGVTDKLRQWNQKRRAKFWGDDMTDSEMIVARSGYTKIEYENGEKIEDEVHRFATIDAGGDHYWMVIAAWRIGGTCRILWEGYIPSDGGDENQLKAICDRYKVTPALTFIDIGYEQDRILDLCVKHGWTGIKGEGNKRYFTHFNKAGKAIEKLYSRIKRARAKSGGIAKFMFLASNPVKDVLSRIIKSGDQVEFPDDTSKPFENHMRCERRVVEKNSKTGEEITRWLRPGNKANHLWDCMCYQVGAALAFRVFDAKDDE
jgi:phage terminase large subunit GpA-like protein